MKLIDKIQKQLNNAGYLVNQDHFTDGSARWLDISNTKKEGKNLSITIDFSMDGSTIESINIWEEELELVIKDQKKLFG